MQKSLSPAQLLTEVDDLLRAMPPVPSFEDPGSEHYAWLGRASALVHRWDPAKAIARFDAFVSQLGSGSLIETSNGAQGVLTMLHQLRHDAILQIPNPQSTSIASGMVFEYFDEIRKVLNLAKTDVLFVDPYLDADFVFAVFAGRVSRSSNTVACARKDSQFTARSDAFPAAIRRNGFRSLGRRLSRSLSLCRSRNLLPVRRILQGRCKEGPDDAYGNQRCISGRAQYL